MSIAALSKHTPELAAVVLALILALAVMLDFKLRDQNGWIAHTLEVESSLNDFEAAMFAAESGQRGFMISNDDTYLDAYREAVANIPKIGARIREKVTDNPQQQALLATLESDSKARLDFLERNLNARRMGDEATVRASFSSHRGQAAMLRMRAILKQMRVTEEKLLAQRRNAADAVANLLTVVMFVGLGALAAALYYWIASSREQQASLTTTNEALRAALAEGEAAAAQMRQMQKMEAVGQLTGGIAHDFNNMLAVIMGGITLALRRMAKGEAGAEQYLTGALDGAQRASTLVKRLLAFARQQPLEPTVIDVNKFITSMSELTARALGEQIRIENVLAAGLWKAMADPSQLESSILNLCVNARDAMPDGGKLTVESANTSLDDDYVRLHPGVAAGQYVMIAVTDTGSGMDPEVAAKAFDPFFTTKSAGKGTGLGLSQVYGFVKQSGGHLKLYSEPGQGTTVKIYLPRHYGEAKVVPIAQAAESPRPQTGTILLVEDEESVRSVVAANLRELGYEVVEAAHAREALEEMANGRTFDLLLTDIVMPDTNGRKLADAAVQVQKDLKVLFMTGFTKNAVVHNGIVDPGVWLLSKPFSIEQLSRAVRRALGRA
jgi:signal transduction histidine kinase/ActR/RegA family two-component response regulator